MEEWLAGGKRRLYTTSFFSGERMIPIRNIQLNRIHLIIKWKTMGGKAGKGGPSPMAQACTF